MGWKDLIFEGGDGEKESKAEPLFPPKTATPGPAPVATVNFGFGPVAPSVAQSALNADADPAMVAQVEAMATTKNFPAYEQFAKVLASLSMIADEPTRYSAALSTVKNMANIDPSGVRDAFEFRVKTVDGLANQFTAQSEAELQKIKTAGESAINILNTNIEARKVEIARLSTELQKFEQQKTAQEAQMEQEKAKINTVAQKLQAAVNVVRQKVTNERDMIARYITGGSR